MDGGQAARLHIASLPYLLGSLDGEQHTGTITASPTTCPGLCQGRSPVGADKLPSTLFPFCVSDTSSRKTKCATQECPPPSILETCLSSLCPPLSTHMPVPLPGTHHSAAYPTLTSSSLLSQRLPGNPPQLSLSLPSLQVLPPSFWHTCDLPHPGSILLPVLGTGPVPSRQRRCEECYL